MIIPMSDKRLSSAEIYENAITTLRRQVWVGLMLISLLALVLTRILRIRDGYTTPTPLGRASMIAFAAIIISGLLLRNSLFAPRLQSLFVAAMLFNTPISLLFFGGAQGIGDLTLFGSVIIALLYGFRRWMYLPLAIIAVSLVYVIGRDLLGRPLEPLVSDTSRLSSIKMILLILTVLLVLTIGRRFYNGLLASYRSHTDDQIALNTALQHNATQLAQQTDQLQTSRQLLIAAREEERRRLRRDLHDGLGPTLAAQVFRVGAARNLHHTQPVKADDLLHQIETSITGVVGQVEQLVDQLRPRRLDQLGLRGAIRDHVQRSQLPFNVVFELDDNLPTLPAAVEVAVWRIVQTALDNVAQHAAAQHCWLTLTIHDGRLQLLLADDGRGISAETPFGVGLASMRERTEELGGHFAVTPRAPSGTTVRAEFSLRMERASPTRGFTD